MVTALAYLASGMQVAYSEAVPAEMIAAQQAASERRMAEETTRQAAVKAAQDAANAAMTTVVTPVVSPATRAAMPTVQGDRLSMPSIGLVASIIPVGLTATNNIDVPAGKQVGRWTGAATPGMPGAVFLDGHVDGVFANLSRAAVGQTFSVVHAGQTFTYKIVHKEVVPLAGIDMNRALSTYGGASEGVNIMTCAGRYVPAIGTYDQRLVVYSVRV